METILQAAVSNAVVATPLALLATAAGYWGRRPALVHALWLLVLLKLVTPPLVAVPVHWLELAAAEPAAAAPAEYAEEWPAFESASPAASDLSVSSLLLVIWLGGAGFFFTLAGVRSWRFARLLRHGRQAPAPLREQVGRLALAMGLPRCPAICVLPGTFSPMIWALGGPARLLIPADLIARLDPSQMEALLAHELAHVRRRDHWVRFLELLVLGLYWWHPVAWWAHGRLREAEENCCDAWVVWALPDTAPAYASALVETVAFLSVVRPSLPPLASGVGYVRFLKGRIVQILCEPPPRRLSRPGFLGVCGLAVLLLPLRMVSATPDEPPRVPAIPQPSALAPEVSGPQPEVSAPAVAKESAPLPREAGANTTARYGVPWGPQDWRGGWGMGPWGGGDWSGGFRWGGGDWRARFERMPASGDLEKKLERVERELEELRREVRKP